MQIMVLESVKSIKWGSTSVADTTRKRMDVNVRSL